MIVLWSVLGLLVYLGIGFGCATAILCIAIKSGRDSDNLLPHFVTIIAWPVVVPIYVLIISVDLVDALFKTMEQMMREDKK